MTQVLLSTRRATPLDACDIADVHAQSWREAYRGIIPGRALESMIARRNWLWWRRALQSNTRILVSECDHAIVGYASVGANRVRFLPYSGEMFEMYLKPEYQGVGYGRRLFFAARKALRNSGRATFVVWALADNDRALRFYASMGGAEVWRASECFDNHTLARVAIGFAD